MSDDDTKRLFLWAVPRSISTAFFRAMMNRRRTKVLLEPYSRSYYYGPERQSRRYQDEPLHPEHSYQAVTAEIEQRYDGMRMRQPAGTCRQHLLRALAALA